MVVARIAAREYVVNLLDNPTPFLFFTGKGGVGKTSLSCATAISLADGGKRALLVSTDPASNLDQVLGTKIGREPTPIASVDHLLAINIDPERAAGDYRERVIGPFRDALPESVIAQMEEQLSGACTVEIAAFDEFTSFLVNKSMIDEFDHVVFDTAPTGHTLRLLNLPAAWSGFLDSNTHGASCLGPASGLKSQHERYTSSLNVLSDAEQTTLVLVSRPDVIALDEAARSGQELRQQGLVNQLLIINGVFHTTEKNDPVALAFQQRNNQALNRMPNSLAQLPQMQINLKGHNLVGIKALRGLFNTDRPVQQSMESLNKPQLTDDLLPFDQLIDDISASENGLIMVMGKGGVGKTTLAAAIASELSQRGFPVHLSTTDPAAHIMQVIGDGVSGLEVSRIDPKQEVDAYTQYIIETKGKDLDEDGLALLEEDLRSPCTEEIAVFRAFSRIVSKARSGFVVLDTAPTGHTLLLLDTTGAYHREVERGAKGSGASYVTPLMRLQNPDYTKILIATLAENTPVSEAAKLQQDLARADIKPYAWIVNQSLALAETTDPVLMQRSHSQVELINTVHQQYADKTIVVPWLANSPTGMEGLKELVTPGSSQNRVTSG